MKQPRNRTRVPVRFERIVMFIFWPLAQWWITVTKIEDPEISDWRIVGILFDVSFVLLGGYAGIDFWRLYSPGHFVYLSGFVYGLSAHIVVGSLFAKWMKSTYNEEVMRLSLS